MIDTNPKIDLDKLLTVVNREICLALTLVESIDDDFDVISTIKIQVESDENRPPSILRTDSFIKYIGGVIIENYEEISTTIVDPSEIVINKLV